MSFNYLNMIWDVKICLAKIKDGKGKELYIMDKKSLLTKIPPKDGEKTFSSPCLDHTLQGKKTHEMESVYDRLFYVYQAGTDRFIGTCLSYYHHFPLTGNNQQ
jgi:hypothetical protein